VKAIRTFFCIELSTGIRQAVARLAEAIQGAVQMRASWVREPNCHVTVRFLGEIDAMSAIDLERVARSICSRIQPFDIVLGQLGAFPSIERPRVLWIGDDAAPAFRGLSSSLDVGLRSLGFPRERNDAVAHVTLARIKGDVDPKLADVVANSQPKEPLRVRAEQLVLMQSELTPRGAVYTPLFTTKLTKAADHGD